MYSLLLHLFLCFYIIVSSGHCMSCPNGYQQISKSYDGIVCQDVSKYLGANSDVLISHLILMKNTGETEDFSINLESQVLNEDQAYFNYTKGQVLVAKEDLLGNYVLEKTINGDPSYKLVRVSVPPIQDIASTFQFTGSRFASVDISFGTNGEDQAGLGFPTPSMFLDINDHSYAKYGGLIGGYLPVVVFLYTKADEAWEFDYVPLPEPEVPGQREQKLYFRALHMTHTGVEVLFNNSYAYQGTYADAPFYEQAFYNTLEAQIQFWEKTFENENAMFPVLPEGQDVSGPSLVRQSLHSIVKDMITRRGFWFPSYGVFPGYGIPGNNGFQEIFTVSLPLALEWGMFDYAEGVLKNYLDHYWLESGNVMYRGLEMAESARMLTQIAMYYRYTGDYFFTSADYLQKVNATVNMLIERYERACCLQKDDPRYCIATGNDEADLFWSTVGGGYTEYPFFSISAEMSRAFRDLGEAFIQIGPQTINPGVVDMGKRMTTLAPEMLANLRNALEKARIAIPGSDSLFCLPYVAGQKECDNIPGASSPRVSEPWRTYSEMMYSGLLSSQNVDDIVRYSRSLNASMKLGMLDGTGGSCCGPQLMTFTSQGFAWGLLQQDRIADFLLMFYTASAHSQSRGHWVAPESTSIDRTQASVAYCSPSQGLVPLMLKWMLVFDDPTTSSIWIGRAMPRDWMKEGYGEVGVRDAPVSHGKLTVMYLSEFTSKKTITVMVDLKVKPFPTGGVFVRVRGPVKTPIRKVTLNGQDYKDFAGDFAIVPSASNIQQFVMYY